MTLALAAGAPGGTGLLGALAAALGANATAYAAVGVGLLRRRTWAPSLQWVVSGLCVALGLAALAVGGPSAVRVAGLTLYAAPALLLLGIDPRPAPAPTRRRRRPGSGRRKVATRRGSGRPRTRERPRARRAEPTEREAFGEALAERIAATFVANALAGHGPERVQPAMVAIARDHGVPEPQEMIDGFAHLVARAVEVTLEGGDARAVRRRLRRAGAPREVVRGIVRGLVGELERYERER